MVCENGRWDVKAVDNVIEDKFVDMHYSSYDNGDYFNPLSEIVYGNYDPLMSF